MLDKQSKLLMMTSRPWPDLPHQFSPGGCWSGVGRQGGRQVINLQFPSCLGRLVHHHPNPPPLHPLARKGTIAHELLHALGFYHEHARPDRKKYVWVMENNVRVCQPV